MAQTIPPRSQVESKYTWNAESVFPSQAAWEAELNAILADLPKARAIQGHLGDSPATLADSLKLVEDLLARISKVYVYAGFAYSVDTTDQNAAAMQGKAQGVYGQVAAATAFVTPELLSIGQEKLTAWLQAEARLAG